MKKTVIQEIWQVLDSGSFGGIETHVFLLAKQLRLNGIPNRVIFIKDYGEHPLYQALRASQTPLSLLDGKFHSLLLEVKRLKPKLIHTHGYKASIFCKFIGKLLNIPVVSTYHSGGTVEPRIKLYHWLDNQLSFLSHNIAVTTDIASRLSKGTRVIENFVEMPVEYAATSTEQKTRIFFVGRLSPEKGPDTFCRLSAFLPEVEFEVFGDGPMRLELESRYGETVKFNGVVTNMRDYWGLASFLCIPSRHEGLPLVALEAMSYGVPVIAYGVGGLKQLIVHGENGLLIQPDHIEKLTDGILSLISLSTSKKAEFSVAARNSIKKRFTAEVLLPKIIERYERVAKKHTEI